MWSALAEGGGVPLADLGQYGVAGVIASIFLWFAWQVYKRERDRADRLEAEKDGLNEKIRSVYVPSMEKWAEALTEQKRLLEALRDERPPPPRRRS